MRSGSRRRLVLYLGAGLSVPWPACGPCGHELADKLRPIVAELLGVTKTDLEEPDLESLAARFEREAPERLGELKDRAAQAWPFKDMEPTYGHQVVALLLREGLVRAVSTNWDCGVENGGIRVEVPVHGASRAIDVLDPADESLYLYKLHGCARRPETLVLTRDEVDTPRLWARAKVEDALTDGTVVFVGLGTVGTYVGEPVKELRGLWASEKTTVHVVDPNGLSPDWELALKEREDDAVIRMSADEFLDDLLRTAVRAALALVGDRARDLHGHERQSWSKATVDGHAALREALACTPADAVLRWWRGCVAGTLNGRAFLLAEAGRNVLMCIAQLAAFDGGEVLAEGTGGNLTIRTERRYFESACCPEQHWREVANTALARIEDRRRNGRYAPGAPIAVVIQGATGRFPDYSAPTDIGAGTKQGGDISAGGDDGIQLFCAADALNGRLAA